MPAVIPGRSLLRLAAGGAVATGLGVAGLAYEDQSSHYKFEEHPRPTPGPYLSLPSSDCAGLAFDWVGLFSTLASL
jgi:hypothetical protein